MIVTASREQTARIWNAHTGEPLTPVLRHLYGLNSAFFVDRGRGIVTVDSRGIQRLWAIALNEKSLPELTSLAHLLTGGSVLSSDDPQSDQPDSLERQWS